MPRSRRTSSSSRSGERTATEWVVERRFSSMSCDVVGVESSSIGSALIAGVWVWVDGGGAEVDIASRSVVLCEDGRWI
jgi:hypothetical protein